MRRLVAALVVALLPFALSACGGSDASTTSAAAAPAPSSVAPAPPAAPAPVVSKTNLLSPSEVGTGQPFPDGAQTPKVVADHLAAHQPMVIFFYDPNQNTSVDQRLEIDAAMKDYRGMIDLVVFDVTGALPDPLTKKTKGAVGEEVALLVQDLHIGFTPYVVLVDSQGDISARFRGFVDRGLLEREILKATQ